MHLSHQAIDRYVLDKALPYLTDEFEPVNAISKRCGVTRQRLGSVLLHAADSNLVERRTQDIPGSSYLFRYQYRRKQQ